jgi:hypothetical protein
MAAIAHPRAWLERRRARHDADYWIGHGFESRYPWRVAELTSTSERRSCVRSLRSVIGELDGSKLPGVTPLRTAALRPWQPLLVELEQRLTGPEAVTAAGMLALNDLLTSPGSCLFSPVDDVESCLRSVLATLEVKH